MASKIHVAAAFLALLVALAACNPAAEKRAAERVAGQMFEIRVHGPAGDAVALYRQAAQEEMPPEAWADLLTGIEARLGRPADRELVSWHVQAGTSAAGTGILVSLKYMVRYEHASATESVVLFRPSGGSEFSIVGHYVDSPAFREDEPHVKRISGSHSGGRGPAQP